MTGESSSSLCALKAFGGHAEEADVHVRRSGRRNIACAGRTEPPLAAE